jgi:hypothetical protein
MRTQNVLRSLLPDGQALILHTLALFLVFFTAPAFAQQQDSEAGQTGETQTVSTPTVPENAGAAGLPSEKDEAPSASMPNAPSATRLQPSQLGSLTLGERWSIYRHSIFRPYTLVGPALGAAVGQWEDEPPEWKQGAEGYARRFGSGAGRHLIAETVRFAVAAADGEDPRYQRLGEGSVWDRARHAIVQTFTSQTSSGTRIPAFSRFAGVYGAAFVSNLWYPDSRATTGWALRRGSTALGSSLGFHLFEEFMPRKYSKALHMQD